jgi:hypothetical protein
MQQSCCAVAASNHFGPQFCCGVVLFRSIKMKRLFYSILTILCMLVSLNLSAQAADTKKCCTTDCKKCITVCSDTLKSFQKKGGKYADAERIKTLKDCIDACKKAETGASEDCCKVCADACKKCATMCEELKDPALKSCIKACNDCAAACK